MELNLLEIISAATVTLLGGGTIAGLTFSPRVRFIGKRVVGFLATIDDELKPNGGTSIKDKVEDTNVLMHQNRADIRAIDRRLDKEREYRIQNYELLKEVARDVKSLDRHLIKVENKLDALNTRVTKLEVQNN